MVFRRFFICSFTYHYFRFCSYFVQNFFISSEMISISKIVVTSVPHGTKGTVCNDDGLVYSIFHVNFFFRSETYLQFYFLNSCKKVKIFSLHISLSLIVTHFRQCIMIHVLVLVIQGEFL